MVRYSVIIPQRDCGDEIARQLPRLAAELDRRELPYEILCVDDGSGPATLERLERLLTEQPALRLLRLDEPAGASTALSAGIAAACGEILIAIEAGERYPVEQIPHLIARLSRLDLVFGRRRLGGWQKLRHRLGRIPRGLLLGLEVRHPDCLFWAARREAVTEIQLGRGMRRYLPWLVARRGFRVGDMYVEEQPSQRRLHDARPNPLDLIAAWWACRQWRDDSSREIEPAAASPPALKIARLDAAAADTSHPILHSPTAPTSTSQTRATA